MVSATYFTLAADELFSSELGRDAVDLIITDPPYPEIEKHRAIGTTTRLMKGKNGNPAWFKPCNHDYLRACFHAMFRALKPDSHFYIFCNYETVWSFVRFGEEAGFKFWKPLIWYKMSIGMGYHYRNTYEMILFFEKGKRALNDKGVSDVFRHKRLTGGYPTEKPLAILETLIRQSSEEGQTVCDPFAGSGSTLLAAVRMARAGIGCDISPEAKACAELRAHQLAPKDSFYFIP